MRRSTGILAILLGVSLLANAGLLVRLGRREPDSAAPRRPAKVDPTARLSDDPAVLKEELVLERKRTEELRTRVERLDADKKLLIQDPSPSGAGDRVARFRDRIRRYVQMMVDPKAAAVYGSDPEMQLELNEGWMEFYRIAVARAKDPQMYAECSRTLVEVMLEELKAPLTGPQASAVQRHFHDLGRAMGEIPRAPAGERFLKELELESAALSKLEALLTPDQKEKSKSYGDNLWASATGMNVAYITAAEGVETVAATWMQAYQLEDAPSSAVNAAARQYVAALKNLEAAYKGREHVATGSSPEAYEYRIRAARAQVDSLRLLEGALTPGQLERLRTVSLREFRLYEASVFQQVETPPEK